MKYEPNDQRRVFMGMARPDQLATLWDQDAYFRGELAKKDIQVIALQDDLKFIKGELAGMGRRNTRDETLTTTQKFNSMMERRFVWWVWYRDRVLASTLSAVHTLIIMAILYLAFGGRLP